MAFHFAKLTRGNGKPVYINGDQVAAIFQPNNQDTLVQFAGDDDNFIYVRESVETVADTLYDAMQE